MSNRFINALVLMLTLWPFLASAQVIWTPMTREYWVNPQTQVVDSQVCLTALSCFGNNCTAVGRMQGDSIFPRLIIWRSNDGGKSWFNQFFAGEYDVRAVNWGFRKVQQIDSLNAVAMAHQYGVIIRTTDGGATWFTIHCPVSRDLLDIHFSDPMTGVLACVGADSNVYTTTDGGKHWVNRPFTPVYSCHSYGNGKFRFHKYGRGPIYTTYDDFLTVDSTEKFFDSISDPEYQHVIARIRYGASDTMYAHGVFYSEEDPPGSSSHGLLMRSTDDGKSWDKKWIFSNTKLIDVRYLSSIERDTIFAAGGDHFHYAYSTDRGSIWQLDTITMATPYAAERCYGVEMAPDGHPIAIFGSVWLPTNSVVVRGDFKPAKVEYAEFIKYHTHFYPNPTSGSVNIETIIRSGMPVTIMDIMGRELMKAKVSQDGRLALDLSHLPPGIYNVVFNFLGRIFIAGKVAKIE